MHNRTTFKSYGDINTLKDLESYRSQLKSHYETAGQQLNRDASHKVTSIPKKLFSPRDTVNRTITKPQVSGLTGIASIAALAIIKNILPKSMGGVKKWLIGMVAKKSIKAMLSTNSTSRPNKDSILIPLSIKTDLSIINEPNVN